MLVSRKRKALINKSHFVSYRSSNSDNSQFFDIEFSTVLNCLVEQKYLLLNVYTFDDPSIV